MELSPAGAGLRRRRGFREDHREGRSLAGGRYDLDRAAVGADEFGPIGVHAPLTLIGSSVLLQRATLGYNSSPGGSGGSEAGIRSGSFLRRRLSRMITSPVSTAPMTKAVAE